ncbi:MAG: hypothetical protein AAB489_05080 [Patescibacteria group bacterium]
MRRLFLCGSALITLASCASQSLLPPEEVLKRASAKTQELESTRYRAEGQISSLPQSDAVLHFLVEGILQNRGAQSSLTLAADGSFSDGKDSYDIQGTLELFLAFGSETYLKLSSLTVDPEHPMLKKAALDRFLGAWWKIPEDAQTSGVTPDPSLLQAQSKVITVVEDKGIVTMAGRRAYHYRVAIDREKLRAYLEKVSEERGEEYDQSKTEEMLAAYSADGEIWIDAETFHIQRLSWRIDPLDQTGKAYAIRFDVTFSDTNAALEISPPVDFELFSPLMFLPTPAPSDPDAFSELDEELKETPMDNADETDVWLAPSEPPPND